MPGEGNGGLADATHGRVNQHPLTLAQTRQMQQGVKGRHVNRDRGCSLVHRQTVGFAEDEVFVYHQPVGDASPGGERNLVSHLAMANLGADAENGSTGFHAHLMSQGRALVGQSGQQPQRHHHVAEIECGGFHPDLHGMGPQWRQRAGPHLKTADGTRIVDLQTIGWILIRTDGGKTLADAGDARNPKGLPPHGQLTFA